MWKLAVGVLLSVTLFLLMINPRNRLLMIGTTSAFTGLAGFVTEISFKLSATLPGGGILQGGVEGGTDIHPGFFLLLLAIGIIAIGFDAVGRGWIWPAFRRKDETRPELSFTLSGTDIPLTSEFSADGQKRFHIHGTVSKDAGNSVQLVSVDIKDATLAEFGVGSGDGVHASRIVEMTGASNVSILGDFPDAKLSRGRAKRQVFVVDEFARRWPAGHITFRSEG